MTDRWAHTLSSRTLRRMNMGCQCGHIPLGRVSIGSSKMTHHRWHRLQGRRRVPALRDPGSQRLPAVGLHQPACLCQAAVSQDPLDEPTFILLPKSHKIYT